MRNDSIDAGAAMQRLSPAARALITERAARSTRDGGRIPASDERETAPLSFVQQMVWLSTQLDNKSSAYNRCSAIRIIGRLDRDALACAISEIVRRHSILRSRVEVVDGTPRMRSFEMERIPLPVTDLASTPPELRAARVRELLDQESTLPFDLEHGPFLRAGIFAEDETSCTLFISTHHIASDGWSDAVMFRELDALYGAFAAGEESPLPDLSIQYSDFAVWQREHEHGPAAERSAAFWQKQMAGAPAAQELPVDHARTAMPSMAGGETRRAIGIDLTRKLESIATREGTTPAMVLFTAFMLLQSRITGQTDTVSGLSVTGRTNAEVERLIGLFNCVVPCRVTIDRQLKFGDLLHAVHRSTLEAREHQSVPVDVILDSLPSARGVRGAEIAQTLFNFRNMPAFEPSLPGLELQPLDTFNRSSVADLELEIIEGQEQWESALRFRTDVYEETTARRLLGHYVTLLESIANAPDELTGRLQLLTSEERCEILVDFNGPIREYPPVHHIHQLIRKQSRRTPAAVAVSWDGGALTYRDLDRASNALAHRLHDRGVASGDLVGICMERSPAMIISLLAILKAGAAFVPFDTDYPPDRLAHMLSDTKPVLLLADSSTVTMQAMGGVDALVVDFPSSDLLDGSDEPPVLEQDDSAVACVLYTSGSTGLPKGVLSTHRGIVNNLQAMQEIYRLTSDDCMLQQTSLGFDAAAWEIFWPLSIGARIWLARPGGQRDAEYVTAVINEQRIATVGFAPSMLKVMLGIPEFAESPHLRRVMSYGEVLSPRLQDALFARMPNVELHNLYGPSETSITVTEWNCERGSTRRSVPIGRPLANTEVYILDGCLEPVPIGVQGEIHIGGVCVSNGYHDRAELTKERFLPHPFRRVSGDRVYRTGDIARFGSDGVIEYVGRRDHQLKIRGVRVELEEIEAALRQLPGVTESVVVANQDADGEYRLIAYAAVENSSCSPIEMRRALEKRLPPQFLPAHIVPLDELPHGPNGKVDRARLPDPSVPLSSASHKAKAPATDLEQKLVAIWERLLHQSEIGVGDSFFELGGHSLLAVRMLQRVADETGKTVSLRSFYDDPTIDAIARFVSHETAAPKSDELPPFLEVRPSEGDTPPFFYLNGQPPGGGKYARRLAPFLPADQGLYVIAVPIFEHAFTVKEVASRFVDLIRIRQPSGPYFLGGNCFGATLAFEIARQLRGSGQEVSLVAMVHPDARTPMHIGFRAMRRAALLGGVSEEFHFAEFSGALSYAASVLREIWREQRRVSSKERRDRIAKAGRWITGFVAKHARRPKAAWSSLRSREAREADERVQDQMRAVERDTALLDPVGDLTAQAQHAAHERFMSEAWTAYTPQPYDGMVSIIWPVEGPANPPWNPRAPWLPLTPRLDWHFVPGNHWTMLHDYFEHSARALGDAIAVARHK